MTLNSYLSRFGHIPRQAMYAVAESVGGRGKAKEIVTGSLNRGGINCMHGIKPLIS
ncbi:MAG: hypothetical protein HS132_17895 [Planctomycetia bacterium]|nr:hypothetical protein [Planctomycetia bacterium]